ncbi:MAG: HPF/RaiA family ribosome-associated protein [Betaproteobacteria bacterium]
MIQPPDIRFLGLEPSDAVEAAAREKALKLEQFVPDLMACKVTIELLHKHRQQGRPFAVRIDVTLPGRELMVDRVQDEDVYVALRDAFDSMKRQLQDRVRRVRGQEKQHPEPLHGQVVRFADDGHCGFIRAADGDEYWFGPENLAGVDFAQLEVGTDVQFIPEVAAEGRQAKRVSVGKHHF